MGLGWSSYVYVVLHSGIQYLWIQGREFRWVVAILQVNEKECYKVKRIQHLSQQVFLELLDSIKSSTKKFIWGHNETLSCKFMLRTYLLSEFCFPVFGFEK